MKKYWRTRTLPIFAFRPWVCVKSCILRIPHAILTANIQTQLHYMALSHIERTSKPTAWDTWQRRNSTVWSLPLSSSAPSWLDWGIWIVSSTFSDLSSCFSLFFFLHARQTNLLGSKIKLRERNLTILMSWDSLIHNFCLFSICEDWTKTRLREAHSKVITESPLCG